MTGFVLLCLLSQSPSSPIAVVVSSKRPGADLYASGISSRVHAALIREGVPAADTLDDAATGKRVKAAGFSDARNCQGGASCLTRLATLLSPHAVVVGVDVGKIGSQLAVRLEAVSAQTGKSLLVTDVSSAAEGWGDKVAVPIALFARRVVEELARLAPPPAPVAIAPRPVPEPAKDVPLAARLVPAVQQRPPAEVKRSTTPAAVKWTLGGGAVAAGGVSVAFLAVGLNARAQFNGKSTMVDGMNATLYTAAEADRLASRSNSQLTLSLVSGIVAAALFVAATYFFVTE